MNQSVNMANQSIRGRDDGYDTGQKDRVRVVLLDHEMLDATRNGDSTRVGEWKDSMMHHNHDNMTT